MPREHSPPRSRTRYEGDRDYDRQEGGSRDISRRGGTYSRRDYDDERPSSRGGDDYSNSRRKRPDDRREYGERDRERERARDRERYESARDKDRERSRRSSRSASPRHRSSRQPSQRPRSSSKSLPPEDKTKPNFKPSGRLAAETNTVMATNGDSTVLKYNEPPEARKPTLGWRLYVFKGAEQLDLLHIHRQSAYLVGRDRLVADIAIEHPSCSKQHAVIQYRQVHEQNEFGDRKAVTKPFIIDLESTNGTQVNDEVIPTARFYELKAGDVIKFGQSNREYVLLHDEAT